jgi:hypothetical protein
VVLGVWKNSACSRTLAGISYQRKERRRRLRHFCSQPLFLINIQRTIVLLQLHDICIYSSSQLSYNDIHPLIPLAVKEWHDIVPTNNPSTTHLRAARGMQSPSTRPIIEYHTYPPAFRNIPDLWGCFLMQVSEQVHAWWGLSAVKPLSILADHTVTQLLTIASSASSCDLGRTDSTVVMLICWGTELKGSEIEVFFAYIAKCFMSKLTITRTTHNPTLKSLNQSIITSTSHNKQGSTYFPIHRSLLGKAQ